MIRAVVWKELREQGLIAATLAVVGGGLLVAVAMLAEPPVHGAPPGDVIRSIGAARLVALMLVVTAGMVCGGALFAAEKEAGTMSFLEALPTGRWALWRAKVLAGVALAAIQIVLVVTVAAALGVADGAFARRLAVYAGLAFAWGALGSTLARTTLGSVGIAIPFAAVAMFVFLFPIMLFFTPPASSMPRPSGWAVFQVLMVVTPLGFSAWRFTAPDRARAAGAAPVALVLDACAPVPDRTGRAGLGVRATVWLTLRQIRLPCLVLSAFAVAFSLTLLLPDARALFAWPALALSAGAIVGLLAFGDEQSRRVAAFWGEQRLPIGRAWWVKIALHLGLLVWLLVLLALPCVVRSQFESGGRFWHGRTTFSAVFHSRLFDELGTQSWKYFLVPAVYGFVFGHLCGLLFRKLVVACGVSLMLGGAAAALWGPSLLAGGVSHWQVWTPAAVVLLTGRLLIRAWASDRAADRGSLVRLAGGGAATVLVLLAAVGYRVFEVPDAADGSADVAFVNALPSYDENVGGREFRAAADRFARAATTLEGADPRRRSRVDERLDAALRANWIASDQELGEWLARLCDETPTAPDDKPWPGQAAVAATRPVGVYDPPALVSSAAVTAAALENGRRMAVALLARGLQLQAQGKPEPFVDAFRAAVALARTMRYGAGQLALTAGIEVERAALYAADRWLERAGSGADLSRAVAGIAAGADDPLSFDPRPHVLADRYVIRGYMQAPGAWLTPAITPSGFPPEWVAAEADLVSFAWAVPWERERTRRLVGLTPDGAPRGSVMTLVSGRPGASMFVSRNRTANDLADAETLLRVVRRAVVLKAAVRAYELEHKTAPTTAAELVPRYLPRVPTDPYSDGREFGYRRSAGEDLIGPARAGPVGRPPEQAHVVAVRPGQVVLWSVGVDRVDQFGKVPPGGPRAEDIVFLVPPFAN